MFRHCSPQIMTCFLALFMHHHSQTLKRNNVHFQCTYEHVTIAENFSRPPPVALVATEFYPRYFSPTYSALLLLLFTNPPNPYPGCCTCTGSTTSFHPLLRTSLQNIVVLPVLQVPQQVRPNAAFAGTTTSSPQPFPTLAFHQLPITLPCCHHPCPQCSHVTVAPPPRRRRTSPHHH